VLQRDAATAFRPDRVGGDRQKGLLGPEMARGKPRTLVFGLSAAIALVTIALRIF
jgi:hypothetical protein